MIGIDNECAISIHKLIIEKTGGIIGVRDCDLLDSALNSCFQTFDNIELYPTIEEKGARLGYSLISNHAFIDGNKRIGLLIMLSFLEINGIKLKYTDDELVEIGLSLADGSITYENLLDWIIKHKI